MKKAAPTIFLIVLTAVMFIYALLQKLEADKQREYAQMERDRAVEFQKEAEQARHELEELKEQLGR